MTTLLVYLAFDYVLGEFMGTLSDTRSKELGCSDRHDWYIQFALRLGKIHLCILEARAVGLEDVAKESQAASRIRSSDPKQVARLSLDCNILV